MKVRISCLSHCVFHLCPCLTSGKWKLQRPAGSLNYEFNEVIAVPSSGNSSHLNKETCRPAEPESHPRARESWGTILRCVIVAEAWPLSNGAEEKCRDRVLGKGGKNGFILLPGKGGHSRLMPWRTVPLWGENREWFYSLGVETTKVVSSFHSSSEVELSGPRTGSSGFISGWCFFGVLALQKNSKILLHVLKRNQGPAPGLCCCFLTPLLWSLHPLLSCWATVWTTLWNAGKVKEAESHSLKIRIWGHRKACAQEPHRALLSFPSAPVHQYVQYLRPAWCVLNMWETVQLVYWVRHIPYPPKMFSDSLDIIARDLCKSSKTRSVFYEEPSFSEGGVCTEQCNFRTWVFFLSSLWIRNNGGIVGRR